MIDRLLVFLCSDMHNHIGPMNVSRLSALEDVVEIRDYLHINMYNPDFKSLWFLKNLRTIRGHNLYR